jgi:hypothetical protein
VSYVVIILAVIAVIGLIAWFFLGRNQPERAATGPDDHRNVDAVGRGTQSPRNVDRPAGADAESMSADEPGGRTPPSPPPDPRPR